MQVSLISATHVSGVSHHSRLYVMDLRMSWCSFVDGFENFNLELKKAYIVIGIIFRRKRRTSKLT